FGAACDAAAAFSAVLVCTSACGAGADWARWLEAPSAALMAALACGADWAAGADLIAACAPADWPALAVRSCGEGADLIAACAPADWPALAESDCGEGADLAAACADAACAAPAERVAADIGFGFARDWAVSAAA